MKWRVRFRQKQKVCCPPKDYWLVRSEIVEADGEQQAREKLQHSWRYNHEIEIKTVEEIKDDTEKGQ